jgi:hypothetical protein
MLFVVVDPFTTIDEAKIWFQVHYYQGFTGMKKENQIQFYIRGATYEEDGKYLTPVVARATVLADWNHPIPADRELFGNAMPEDEGECRSQMADLLQPVS